MNKKIAQLAPRKAAIHVAEQVDRARVTRPADLHKVSFEEFAKKVTTWRDTKLTCSIKQNNGDFVFRITDGDIVFEAYINNNLLHPKQATDNLIKYLSQKPPE